MKIALGGDHAGYRYKQSVADYLKHNSIDFTDYGPFAEDSVDYPDFVHPVAHAIEAGEYDMGILICGSGNGVAMTANKHADIRAALCWNEDLSVLARSHNDANVLCIPARFVDEDMMLKMVNRFLNTPFEGGRHQKRVDKISNC